MDNKLNKEQMKNLKILSSGKNVFLTGEAGTGKSFLIKEFIKQKTDEGKNVLITAPTGISALNIDGITVHKAFGVPTPAYGSVLSKITLSKIKLVSVADIIIIDEISMCRNDVFEYVYACIDKVKKELKKNIQLIVLGDFYQLPPVVTKSEKTRLRNFGLDISGFCFTTLAWKKFNFKVIKLVTPMRQTDSDFLLNLNKLRIGDKTCLKYFKTFIQKDITVPDDVVYICPTNAGAKLINDEKLQKLPGLLYSYLTVTTGYITGDKPIDDVLFLKNGCKVVFTVNDVVNNNYQNGSIGVVTECLENSVNVLVNGKELEVKPYTWNVYTYKTRNGVLKKDSIATIKQFPLKLAYATTIHKSQGQTYPKAIINPAAFADGQLYVALSRLSNPQGLILDNDLLPIYLKTNTKVNKFYDTFSYEISDAVIKKRKEIELKQKKAIKTKRIKKKSISKNNKLNKSKPVKNNKIKSLNAKKSTSAKTKSKLARTATTTRKKTKRVNNQTTKKR